MTRFLIKLDRIAAWTLMIVMILYAVSGYGLTKGLINIDFARSLHLSWLGAIGLAAFVIHTSWAIRLAFIRRQIWNGYTRFALFTFYILLAGFFLYVHFFYTPSYNKTLPAADNQAATASTNSSSVAPTETKVFTAASLAYYDGLNGRPAYAAVSGVVYDVSSVFKNGNHHGYSAGIDLTALFYSQHPAQLLSRYQIVGTYQK